MEQHATKAAVQVLDAKIDVMADRLNIRIVAMESRILTALGQAGKIDRRQVIMDYRVDGLEKCVKSIEDRPS